MKRKITFTSALAAVVLAILPLQSEACFFGFSFGGGGWGYPSYYGWHNPHYYGYRHQGYAPYRHYAYRYTPYRHYAYNRTPYRSYIRTWNVVDAPELLAEK